MVNRTSFQGLAYQASDLEYLKGSLGLDDPNRDGYLSPEEYQLKRLSRFREFYERDLSDTERTLLQSFSMEAPLTHQSFFAQANLAAIAQKFLQHRVEYRLKHELKLPLDRPVTPPAMPAHPNTDFTRMDFDMPYLKKNLSPANWQILTGPALTPAEKKRYPSPLILMLRDVFKNGQNRSRLTVTESSWQTLFFKLKKNSPPDFAGATPASTWNELMLVWEKSDDKKDRSIGRRFWRKFLSLIDNSRVGRDFDLAFLPSRFDMGHTGLEKFFANPAGFQVPQNHATPQSADPVQQASVHWDVSWPNHPTRIQIKDIKGLAGIHLDIEENARMLLAQDVNDGSLGFSLGRPLLWLKGFHVNTDAGRHTRTIARIFDFFTNLHGKNFDVETLTTHAITVYNNRICLVVRGESQNRDDLVKPVFRDLTLIDITVAFKNWLGKRPHAKKLEKLLFDASGNLFSNVPSGDLAHALVDFFKGQTIGHARLPVPPEDFKNQLWISDLATNPTGQNGEIQNGQMHVMGSWPDRLILTGKADLQAEIEINGSPIKIRGPVEIHFDSQKQSGFVRLTLPELKLNATGTTQSAKILAELKLDLSDLGNQNHGPNTREIFAKAVENLLIEIKNPDGPWLTLLAHKPRLQIQPELEIETEIRGILRGELGRFLGLNGKVIITNPEPDKWIIVPNIEKLDANNGSITASVNGMRGHITVQKLNKAGGQTGYTITLENLFIVIPDAVTHTGTLTWRGKTVAVINGTWQFVTPSQGDDPQWGARWNGSGTLRINHEDSELKLTGPDKSPSGTLSDLNHVTEIEIHDILFPGFSGTGNLKGKIESGHVKISSPSLDVETDLKGSIRASGNLPNMIFTSSENPPPNHPLQSVASPDNDAEKLPPEITDTELSPREFIDTLLAPVIARVIDTPPTPTNLDFYLSHKFPLEALLRSIQQATLSIGNIPLAENGHYKMNPDGHEFTQIPFFKGAFLFLNPKIEKNTSASIKIPQDIVVDERLRDFKIDLSPPIRFLGRRITGLGLTQNKFADTDPNRKHLYLFTPSGKIDVVGFLRAAFPCKIAKIYRLLRQDGIEVRRNEIPTETGNLARFLRHFLDVFEFERKVRERSLRQEMPFNTEELSHLTSRQKQMAYQLIGKTTVGKHVSRSIKSLPEYLNNLSRRVDLAEYFQQNLDLFDPALRAEARALIEDILYSKFLIDDHPLSTDIKNEIELANRKLLRIYLNPLIHTTQWFDGQTMRDIDAQILLHPQQADYSLVDFKKTATDPVTTRLRFNPTHHEDFTDKPVPSGLYLNAATGQHEFLTDVFFNLKTSSLWVKGDFNRVHNLAYYLGPKSHTGDNDFAVSFEQADVDNLDVSHMKPNRLGRPKFAIFSPESKELGDFNHVMGKSFSLTYLNDTYHYNFHMDDVSAGATYLYFVVGNRGEERDMLINLDGADLKDFQFDTSLIPDADGSGYSGDINHISGDINLGDGAENSVRAMIYIGDSAADKREYLVVDRLVSKGDFTMEGQRMKIRAAMHLKASLPEYMQTFPLFKKLKDKGLRFQFDSLSLDGDLLLSLNENGGGVQRIGPDEQTEWQSFQPSYITLHGQFDLDVNGLKLTLSEIRLPLEELAFAMERQPAKDGGEITATWIKKILIPANEKASSRIDLKWQIPKNLGGNTFTIENGEMNLSSDSPLTYLSTDPDQGTLNSTGLHFNTTDTQTGNILDLSTGQINLSRDGGALSNWRISAELHDLILDTLLKILLEGERMTVKVKKEN